MSRGRITGFVFLVHEQGAARWVQLQGWGGLYGAQSVESLRDDESRLEQVKQRLLWAVRHELHCSRELREWTLHSDPAPRIRRIQPDRVEGVEVLRESVRDICPICDSPNCRSAGHAEEAGIRRSHRRGA